eukprot:11184490-Lingulodinium_polyedra.AAC.1
MQARPAWEASRRRAFTTRGPRSSSTRGSSCQPNTSSVISPGVAQSLDRARPFAHPPRGPRDGQSQGL